MGGNANSTNERAQKRMDAYAHRKWGEKYS